MMWNYILLVMIVFVCCGASYFVGWLNGVVYGVAFKEAQHGN